MLIVLDKTIIKIAIKIIHSRSRNRFFFHLQWIIENLGVNWSNHRCTNNQTEELELQMGFPTSQSGSFH
jgi:hypothetical protein